MQPRPNNHRNQREPRRQRPFYQQNVRQGDQRPPFVQEQNQMNVPAPFQGPPPQQQFVAPQPYQQAPNQHHAYGMQQEHFHPPPQVPMIPRGHYQAPYPADAQGQYQHQQQVPYQVPYQGPHHMQPQGHYQAHPQAPYQVPYQAQQQGFNQVPPQYPQQVPQQGAYNMQPQQFHPAAPQVPDQVPYEDQQQGAFQQAPQQGYYQAPQQVIYQPQPYGGFYQPPVNQAPVAHDNFQYQQQQVYQPNYQYGPPAPQQQPMIPAQPVPQYQLGGVPYQQDQYQQPPQDQEHYQHPQAQGHQEQEQMNQVPVPQTQEDHDEMPEEDYAIAEVPEALVENESEEQVEPVIENSEQSSAPGQSSSENVDDVSLKETAKKDTDGNVPSENPKKPEQVPIEVPKRKESSSGPSTSSRGSNNREESTGDSRKATEDGVPLENTRGGYRGRPARGHPKGRGYGRGRGPSSGTPSVPRYQKDVASQPVEQVPEEEDVNRVTESAAGLSLEDHAKNRPSEVEKDQTDLPNVDVTKDASESANGEAALPTPTQEKVTPLLSSSPEIVEPEPAPKVVEKKEKKSKSQKKAAQKAKKAQEEDDFEQLLADAQKKNAAEQEALDKKKADARRRLNQYVAVFSLHRNRYLCFRNNIYDLLQDEQIDIALFVKNQDMFAWVTFIKSPEALIFLQARIAHYSNKKGDLARAMIEYYELMLESEHFIVQQDIMWIYSKHENPAELERCEKALRKFVFEGNIDIGPTRPLTLDDASCLPYKELVITDTMMTKFMSYLMKQAEIRSLTTASLNLGYLTDLELRIIETHKLCLSSGNIKPWTAENATEFCLKRVLEKREGRDAILIIHQWQILGMAMSSIIEFDLECLSILIQKQPSDADDIEKQYLKLVFGDV